MTSHSKGGTNTTKDVIYIDVDDEITGIIDKVRSSEKKIVALVLPKRATVLQSVVNMKLLKRAAGDSKKNLVLITAEAGLLPLAGSIGLHVAKSLNSKPEVPDAPAHLADKAEPIEEIADAAGDDLDKNRTVGELSGDPAPDDDADETIELDDEADALEPEGKDGKVKKAKNKKFKIPNFNKFRLLLALAAIGVILLGGLTYAAVAVWPKAKITIKTDSTAVNSSLVLALKTGEATKLDVEKAILKAVSQEVKKTLTQEVATTGEKNNGKKAKGEIKIINCTDGDSLTIPEGTIVSRSGQTFVTEKEVHIPLGSTSCFDYPDASSKTVDITAVNAGTKSNVSAGSFVVAGYSSRTQASSSEATKGGTDDITRVVSQTDVDKAKQKIAELDDQAVRGELKTALISRSLLAVEETFSTGKTETKLSHEVNDEAETLTVTQTVTFSMLGVNQEDLEKILAKNVEDDIDTKKQSITDYGLDEAVFGLQSVNPDGASVTLQATVVAGAELDPEAIKKQVAGKKAGDAKSLISANPGVTDVDVEYSPFWVSSIPKKIDKITVIIQEPQVSNDDAPASP